MSELPQIEGVNKDFFVKYGRPDDPDSFLSKSKIIMVRHAKSMENMYYESIRDGTENDELIYGTLRDCHLSDLGVQQAKYLQPIVNMLEFAEDCVYCSPHRRTMETLCYMLDTHP